MLLHTWKLSFPGIEPLPRRLKRSARCSARPWPQQNVNETILPSRWVRDRDFYFARRKLWFGVLVCCHIVSHTLVCLQYASQLTKWRSMAEREESRAADLGAALHSEKEESSARCATLRMELQAAQHEASRAGTRITALKERVQVLEESLACTRAELSETKGLLEEQRATAASLERLVQSQASDVNVALELVAKRAPRTSNAATNDDDLLVANDNISDLLTKEEDPVAAVLGEAAPKLNDLGHLSSTKRANLTSHDNSSSWRIPAATDGLEDMLRGLQLAVNQALTSKA